MSGGENTFDIAVIGAGIAGASVAAELAADADYDGRVVLLEQEAQPGYHTTGRSAAIYSPVYGPRPIRALTRAAHDFYMSPPDGFADHALLTPIACAFVARADQASAVDAMQAEMSDADSISRLDGAEMARRMPLLRDGYADGGLWDTGTSEIDVAALHQGYLRMLRAGGGTLRNRATVTALTRSGDGWDLETAAGPVHARIVINATGAWADRVGDMAGAEKIGLVPKRRTAMMIEPPAGCDTTTLPMVIDIAEQFYLKPDAGKLLISPANEDPEPPSDVQPDEMDIAICVDRIERAFDLTVRRIENRWAGLRSFVADKAPVAAFSKQVDGFYWLAGQGGYGIQSAPGLARYAADEVLGRPMAQRFQDQGLDPADIAADRPGIGPQ